MRPLPPAIALALAFVVCSACSIRRVAIANIADAFGGIEDVFATDDDIELVRAALPFGLKTMEALMLEAPDNEELLLAACRGFAQYSYAFVHSEAELIEADDYAAAEALRTRALKLYLRAKGYGLRGLELRRPGVTAALAIEPDLAAQDFGKADVPFLFWTGAAWGSAIALGLDRPEIVADVDAMRALLNRALELDEGYGEGAIHEALIVIESLPEMMGGSLERAREHYARALALTDGRSAGPHVSLAENIAIPGQDRAEFDAVIAAALAVDPELTPHLRLANTIAQRHARHLQSIAGDLFLEPLD